jgi:hypothetical protein
LRAANFNVLFTASWSRPEDDADAEQWVSHAASQLRAVLGVSGFDHTYINYASETEHVAAELESSYLEAVERLDPSGLLSRSRRG